MRELEKLKSLLLERQNVGILSHQAPDGDTIGSALALWHVLQPKGCNLRLLCSDNVPYSLQFLPASENFSRGVSQSAIDSLDILICLDTAAPELLGKNSHLVSQVPTVNIDHHPSNTRYGYLNIVEASYSSAAEILLDIFDQLGYPISENVASCLLTGILSDTGGLTTSNVSADTIRKVARLVSLGADIHSVMYELYRKQSLQQLKFRTEILNRINIELKGALVWSVIPRKMMGGVEDVEIEARHIIATMQYLEGVKLAILFKEQGRTKTRVSLRSNSNVSVQEVAELFGGGGHRYAAGCTIPLPLDISVDRVLASVRTSMDERE